MINSLDRWLTDMLSPENLSAFPGLSGENKGVEMLVGGGRP